MTILIMILCFVLAIPIVIINDKYTQTKKYKDERNNIVSGNVVPQYKLLSKVDSATNSFEEKAWVSDVNRFVSLSNETLKAKQHNEFVERTTERLQFLNGELGYAYNLDVDKLPKVKVVSKVNSAEKHITHENFKKLYDYFVNTDEWKDLICEMDRINYYLSQRGYKNIFLDGVKTIYQDFLKGYQVKIICLFDFQNVADGYLLFFPCYVVYISTKQSKLKIIPYTQVKFISHKRFMSGHYKYENVDGTPDRRRKDNPYISNYSYYFSLKWDSNEISVPDYEHAEDFVAIFGKFTGLFKNGKTAEFFKNTYNTDLKKQEELKKQQNLKLREEFISNFATIRPRIVTVSELSEKYNNNLDKNLNSGFMNYIRYINQNKEIENYNTTLQEKRELLRELNEKLGYEKEKDIEVLPKYE